MRNKSYGQPLGPWADIQLGPILLTLLVYLRHSLDAPSTCDENPNSGVGLYGCKRSLDVDCQKVTFVCDSSVKYQIQKCSGRKSPSSPHFDRLTLRWVRPSVADSLRSSLNRCRAVGVAVKPLMRTFAGSTPHWHALVHTVHGHGVIAFDSTPYKQGTYSPCKCLATKQKVLMRAITTNV